MKQLQRIVKNAVFRNRSQPSLSLVYLATVSDHCSHGQRRRIRNILFVLAFAMFFQLLADAVYRAC